MTTLGINRQRTQQQSSGRSFVDPNQEAFLSYLRNAAQGVTADQLGSIGGAAQGLSGDLGGIGRDLLSQTTAAAGGQLGAQQQLSGIIGQLSSGTDPGGSFLRQRLSQQNPFLNEQIAALGQDIGQQFTERVLPGIRRDAVGVGALGGDRQGIAEGVAAQGAQRSFASQAANLRAGDLAARQAAAAQLSSNAVNAGNLAGGLGGQQISAAQSGTGALGGLFNLGLAPYGAQFAPLQALAGIIGGPTVLSEQQGSSSGSSGGLNLGFGSLFTGTGT